MRAGEYGSALEDEDSARTGRNMVMAMKMKNTPAPMKAAKKVNCCADGMLRQNAGQLFHWTSPAAEANWMG